MSIEPVAYINVTHRKLEWAKVTEWHTPTVVNLEPIPLYTQREWIGLTNDEIDKLRGYPKWDLAEIMWVRIIEQALKDKNT